MFFECKILLACRALHGLVTLFYVQVSATRTSENFITMLTSESSFNAKMDVFDVSLQTDELGEAAPTLVAHKVLSFLVNSLNMQLEAMRADNRFSTVWTRDFRVLFCRGCEAAAANVMKVLCQMVNLFLMTQKGPKGLEWGTTTITEFCLLFFLSCAEAELASFFRHGGVVVGLQIFGMKDSDMTLE